MTKRSPHKPPHPFIAGNMNNGYNYENSVEPIGMHGSMNNPMGPS